MADYATYAQAAANQRSAMLSNLRTSRAVSAAGVPAPASIAPSAVVASQPIPTVVAPAPAPAPGASGVPAAGANGMSEIEVQLQQMRLQNLQLQEHLLMQQAQAQATAQQYAFHQQRWLQQQLATQMMQRAGLAGYYGTGNGLLQEQLAAQRAQLLALLGTNGAGGQQQQQQQQQQQPAEEAWDENQEAAAERAWLMEQLSAGGRAAQEAAALAGLDEHQVHLLLNEAQQQELLRARLIAAAEGRAQSGGHVKQSSSIGSNSSSTARLSASPPPTLVLSRPDEAFPVFAAEDKTPRIRAKGSPPESGHRHQASLSSTSSSEGGDSSGSNDYDSATTAGTNLSAFGEDAKHAAAAMIGLGRPNQAAGLTAALSGAGHRQSSRPGSAGGVLNPFAASFAPSAPSVAAPIFAPIATPMTAVPQTATPFRVQSSPNPIGVMTAIPARMPKGPASEADLPTRNFASMARKRNLTLLGRRNPSSPTSATGNFAAAQEASMAQMRKGSGASLIVPGLYDDA